MFGFQFGSQDWWDCPFEMKRMASDLRGLPGDAGEALALAVTVIDASTGVIAGLRLVGLPTHFADTLRQAVVS